MMFYNVFFSKKAVKVLWVGLLGLLVLFLLLKPSGAMQQDLGRHLKLGEIIFETGSVPNTNLFTYTSPDFTFVNHHWLSEVVFYLIHSVFGLNGLFALKLFLITAALFLAFYAAFRLAGFFPAVVSFLVFLPFVTYRVDERPELFGFLLFSLLFLILFALPYGKRRLFFGVPIIIFLWVNFHLSFAFGVFLVGVWILREFWRKRLSLKERLFLILSVCLAVFLNPNGFRGALYPLTIFSNYGYRVLENQNIFFLISRINNQMILYFFGAVFLLMCGILYSVFGRRKTLILHFLAIVFMVLSFKAIRNFSFFGLIGIPVFALTLAEIKRSAFVRRFSERFKFLKNEENTLLPGAAVFIVFLIVLVLGRPMFFGIPEHGKKGVDFFLSQNLPGNIFNNFDVGGYLDYRLYPKHKVFIDNRPEAFPKEFFQEYIKIQQDPEFRKTAFERYNIKTVIFSHTDITPWAQEFLRQIVQDKEWKILYLDNFLIILRK